MFGSTGFGGFGQQNNQQQQPQQQQPTTGLFGQAAQPNTPAQSGFGSTTGEFLVASSSHQPSRIPVLIHHFRNIQALALQADSVHRSRLHKPAVVSLANHRTRPRLPPLAALAPRKTMLPPVALSAHDLLVTPASAALAPPPTTTPPAPSPSAPHLHSSSSSSSNQQQAALAPPPLAQPLLPLAVSLANSSSSSSPLQVDSVPPRAPLANKPLA